MLTEGEIITHNECLWTISREIFWHVAPTEIDLSTAIKDKANNRLCMSLNNIYLGKGFFDLPRLLESKSTLQRAKSPNEEIFEEIRVAEFAQKPCRYRCVYLFKSRQDAENKNIEWFYNKGKILKCHVVLAQPYSIFEADLNHISMISEFDSPDNVREIARKYWEGDLTIDKNIEVLVDGIIYFPDWPDLKTYDLRSQIKKYIKLESN